MPVWRRNEEGRACALVVTKLGGKAIKGDADRQTVDAGLEAPAPSSMPSAACSQTAASPQTELSIPRQGSKLADVMALLGRKQGAGIEELTSITARAPSTPPPGWAGPSVRQIQLVVAVVGVRLQDAGVCRQMGLRMLAAAIARVIEDRCRRRSDCSRADWARTMKGRRRSDGRAKSSKSRHLVRKQAALSTSIESEGDNARAVVRQFRPGWSHTWAASDPRRATDW